MPMVEAEVQAARRQLEQVLERKLFARSEQLSRLLRFLVEQHLKGRDAELKESVVGVEVFGRKPDYNPKTDPIVRTEVRRLRERLSEYYQNEGISDGVRIELPKGGYVPVLRSAAIESARLVAGSQAARRRPGRWLWAGAGVACVLGAAGLAWNGSLADIRSPAYDLCRRARSFEALPNLSGVETSIDLFQQAITKDPSFGPAYAGIAAGYVARSGFDRFDVAQRTEMLARGWAAAERAMQLDPSSADSQEALAMMQARQSQWEIAERGFRRAIQLAPREVLWRQHFVMFLLLPLDRVEEAIRELRAVEELDPLASQTHTLLSAALRSAGRFDEAFFHCQKGSETDQLRASCWADSLQRQGKSDEAVRILEPIWRGHLLEPGAQILGVAYARAGRREEAERIAEGLPRLGSKAQIFAALGDKDRTFELLAQMIPMGPARIGRDFLLSQNFAFLRGDPRLKALRKKVGLPEG